MRAPLGVTYLNGPLKHNVLERVLYLANLLAMVARVIETVARGRYKGSPRHRPVLPIWRRGRQEVRRRCAELVTGHFETWLTKKATGIGIIDLRCKKILAFLKQSRHEMVGEIFTWSGGDPWDPLCRQVQGASVEVGVGVTERAENAAQNTQTKTKTW